VLLSRDDEDVEDDPEGAAQLNELYDNMPIYTRFGHLFEYEGNYHSYVLAQILSQHLFYEKPRGLSAVKAAGLSKKMRDIYSKGGGFDYNALLR